MPCPAYVRCGEQVLQVARGFDPRRAAVKEVVRQADQAARSFGNERKDGARRVKESGAR